MEAAIEHALQTVVAMRWAAIRAGCLSVALDHASTQAIEELYRLQVSLTAEEARLQARD
ncbi:MAG TPA: hypothetical protein PJ986_17640 [Gammaproteobacteria bacterium]|nr:hypothetical protein [Gammaproteobacteria bacterium]